MRLNNSIYIWIILISAFPLQLLAEGDNGLPEEKLLSESFYKIHDLYMEQMDVSLFAPEDDTSLSDLYLMAIAETNTSNVYRTLKFVVGVYEIINMSTRSCPELYLELEEYARTAIIPCKLYIPMVKDSISQTIPQLKNKEIKKKYSIIGDQLINELNSLEKLLD